MGHDKIMNYIPKYLTYLTKVHFWILSYLNFDYSTILRIPFQEILTVQPETNDKYYFL